MRKLFMAALLFACTASLAFSQTAGGSDYHKYDFGILYSHDRVDTGFDDPSQNFLQDREGFNGVEGFAKYNFSRYLGAVGDYSFHRKTFDEPFATTAATTRITLTTLLGGVEVKDNTTETKVKPFARGLVGFQHASADITGVTGFDTHENGFAAAIGGGVDFRINHSLDVRAIQFDYNPTR